MDRTGIQWGFEPLRKYATFSGRAPRSEYWWFYLLTVLVQGFAATVDNVSGSEYAGYAIALALALPWTAVYVRRLHDLDRSGWWTLAPLSGLIPAAIGLAVGGPALFAKTGPSGPGLVLAGIGALVFFGICILQFVWLCTRGTSGPNRFGDDPLDPTADVAAVFS